MPSSPPGLMEADLNWLLYRLQRHGATLRLERIDEREGQRTVVYRVCDEHEVPISRSDGTAMTLQAWLPPGRTLDPIGTVYPIGTAARPAPKHLN